MKKLLYSFALLFSMVISAQQPGNVVVEWKDNASVNFGDFRLTMPQFNPDNFNVDVHSRTVFFSIKTPVTTAVDANALQITNISYEPIQQSQVGDLKVSALPQEINAKVKTVRARGKMFAHITFSPIIKDGNSIKRVKSFTYSLNPSASRPARPTRTRRPASLPSSRMWKTSPVRHCMRA